MSGRRVWLLVLVLLWPLSPPPEASAKTPHIGLLSIGTDPGRPLPPQWLAFLDGLRQYGYVDGQTIAIERRFLNGKAEQAVEAAAGLAEQKVDLIVVTGTREVQAAHRATTTIPIVTREFVDVGGLMAYGPSFVDLFGRAPVFVDKILKGARPAELPIEQPTKFELLVNLTTARTMGLSLPPSLVARADEVIQ